jgi:hypothetical protein
MLLLPWRGARDEEGKPLVRDCSCRGDSAGFAHLSCLTTFADQKCKKAGNGDVGAFREPWKLCNNCKQLFQGPLLMDLASAGVSLRRLPTAMKETAGGIN